MKKLLTLVLAAGAALALPASALAQTPAPDCPIGTEPAYTVEWPPREVPIGRTVYTTVWTNTAGPFGSFYHHVVMRGDTPPVVFFEGDDFAPATYWRRFYDTPPYFDKPGETATIEVSWTQWPARTYTPGQADCRMSASATFVATPRVAPDDPSTDPYAPWPSPTPMPTPPSTPPVDHGGEVVPRARCKVPSVKGLTVRRAAARLRRAHCRLGKVRRVRSHRRSGRVLRTSPRPGVRLARGAKVHFTVSA